MIATSRQAHLAGAIHDPHSAARDFLQQFVIPERADLKRIQQRIVFPTDIGHAERVAQSQQTPRALGAEEVCQASAANAADACRCGVLIFGNQ